MVTQRQRQQLMSAAGEGAQLRSAATAADSGLYAPVSGFAPRSVILIPRQPVARAAAEAAAGLAADATAPVVVSTGLPRYTGSLDCVVVLSDDPGDRTAAEFLATADHRGAVTVLVGAGDGPLRAAAGPRTVVAPEPAFGDAGSFLRALGTILSLLSATGVSTVGSARALHEVADLVDADQVRCAPERDILVNPARILAAQTEGHRTVFAAAVPEMAPLANLGALAWLRAGQVAGATGLDEVLRSSTELVATGGGEDIFRDIFADVQPEESAPLLPLGAVVLSTAAHVAVTRQRLEAFSWARVHAPGEDAEVVDLLTDIAVTAARLSAAAPYTLPDEN